MEKLSPPSFVTTRIRPKISASAGPLTTRDPDVNLPEHLLASSNELSDFLAEVEHRAFKQAVFAVRDRDSALDLVQDAMLRLSSKYGDHPAG